MQALQVLRTLCAPPASGDQPTQFTGPVEFLPRLGIAGMAVQYAGPASVQRPVCGMHLQQAVEVPERRLGSPRDFESPRHRIVPVDDRVGAWFEVRRERAIHDPGAPLAPRGGIQRCDGFARVLLLAGYRLHPQLDQGGVAGNRLRYGPAPRGAVAHRVKKLRSSSANRTLVTLPS